MIDICSELLYGCHDDIYVILFWSSKEELGPGHDSIPWSDEQTLICRVAVGLVGYIKSFSANS